jgi:hypothetical protein
MKKQTVTLKPKEGQQDRLPGLPRSREKDIRPSHLNGFTEQPLLGFKETMLISISKTPCPGGQKERFTKGYPGGL